MPTGHHVWTWMSFIYGMSIYNSTSSVVKVQGRTYGAHARTCAWNVRVMVGQVEICPSAGVSDCRDTHQARLPSNVHCDLFAQSLTDASFMAQAPGRAFRERISTGSRELWLVARIGGCWRRWGRPRRGNVQGGHRIFNTPFYFLWGALIHFEHCLAWRGICFRCRARAWIPCSGHNSRECPSFW